MNKGYFRQFPQATEEEQQILSASILGAAGEVLSLLKPDDFYSDRHREIFSAISAMNADSLSIDLPTLVSRLRGAGKLDQVGGAGYVARLVDTVPAAGSLDYIAARIREAAVRRQVIMSANELAKTAYDGDFESLQKKARHAFRDLDAPTATGNIFASYADLAETMPERWEQLEKKPPGVPSGLDKVDRLIGGFQPSDLVVVAARPGMGKTAFALCASENAARKGFPVAIFSLEMSKSQLYGRQTAKTARVDSQKLRLGGIHSGEWERIMAAQAELYRLPVFIDDSPLQHINEICRRSRWAADKLGAKLVVVDYLQLIRGDNQQQRKDLEISNITGALKGLAKFLNVPVILLSQLNRGVETRDNKRPRLSDLRESGAIEQDADIVMFLYRDEYYNYQTLEPSIAEVNIAKHRNGPTGTVKLQWVAWRQSFENIEKPTNF